MEKLFSEDTEEPVASFQKNSLEIVKAKLRIRNRHRYVDVRIYRLEEGSSPGSEQPTTRGICINCELLPELRRLIDETIARASQAELTAGREGRNQRPAGSRT